MKSNVNICFRKVSLATIGVCVFCASTSVGALFIFGGKNMDNEKIQYLGYEIVLIYQPFYDDSTPKSRQYRVIVKKENIEFINRYGLTRGSALAYSKKWINKKENMNY